ncbi:MAG: magnesium-dependent phosphatase-1, partial [Planctomycetes bacterium]|nr:magnesium-dependent phosphatase-1 [Planctomycetota bacterium]
PVPPEEVVSRRLFRPGKRVQSHPLAGGRPLRGDPRRVEPGESTTSASHGSMNYKLFVFDLDETLWTVSEGLVSLIEPPFRLVSSDRLETEEGYYVELKSGVRDLFDFLRKDKRYISLASRNDPQPTMAILEAFGLDKLLDFPQLCWRPKEESIERIIKEIHARDKVLIKPSEVLFVDDWPENIPPVRNWGATALLFGQDVISHSELLNILR